jgi:cytochrome c biogenesis protein CcmG/thiol:disulfide interchange protein DsbE
VARCWSAGLDGYRLSRMSPSSPPEAPVEDRPDEPASSTPVEGRPFPTGLLVAGILATVVLGAAVIVAVRSGSSTTPSASDPSGSALVDKLGGGVDLTGKPLPPVSYASFGTNEAQTIAQHYGGEPLVINFWSSTCAPCVTEMPDFQKVHEQYGDRVAFLGLDVTDSEDSGQAMLDKTKVRYDVGRDPQGDALVKLGSSSLPTTLLVGADGNVAVVHIGAFSGDDLKAAIDHDLLP